MTLKKCAIDSCTPKTVPLCRSGIFSCIICVTDKSTIYKPENFSFFKSFYINDFHKLLPKLNKIV